MRPFVRDTLTLQSGQVVLAVVHALRAFLVLRWLGPVEFGPLALAQSLVVFVSLVDASAIGRAALVEVARAVASRDHDGMAGALSRFLGLHVVLSVGIVAIVWWLGPWVSEAAYGRAEVGHYARWLALPLVLEAPFLTISVVLQAARRVRTLVAIEAARAGLLLVSTLVALVVQASAWSVVAAGIATSGLTLMGTLAGQGWLRRAVEGLPSWQTLVRRVPRERFGPTMQSGGLVALDKHAGNLAGHVPVLLLGLVDTTAVAHLAAAIRVMAVPAPLLTGLARSLDTTLALRAARGSRDVVVAWREATWRAAGAWLPIAMLMAAAAWVGMVPVLGEAYAPARAAILPLLVQSIALGAGVGLGPAYRALDAVWRSLVVGLLVLAVAIGPGWWMVETWGVAGAAWFHAVRTGATIGLGAIVVSGLARIAPRASGTPSRPSASHGGQP
ncbi:MAG: oligosaccharide flippase family protein [Vicinamibacteraceae bacterium]|nr:oligosaccharide flippase family protein [Vicinamibacteraceae bacterium]